jgi:hypothetical protein
MCGIGKQQLSEVIFVLLPVLCKSLESNLQFTLKMDCSVCVADACGAFIGPDKSQVLRQL